MTLQHQKTFAAAGWVMAVLAVLALMSPTSASVAIGLALLATVPPLLAWPLWNTPPQTMSERIQRELR
jgi:hypothetical protein